MLLVIIFPILLQLYQVRKLFLFILLINSSKAVVHTDASVDQIPTAEFTTALDDFDLATKFIKKSFFLPLVEMIYHKSDLGTNLSNLRKYYTDLLKIYYELEDFESFVKTNIMEKLLNYRRTLLLVQTYSDRYERIQKEFEKAIANTKLQVKSEMSSRFPKKRALETYPLKTFTDIIRPEVPQNASTVICSPIAPEGGQVLDTTLEFETSKEMILEQSEDNTDALKDNTDDFADSLSFYTARSHPTGPIIVELDNNDIDTYIQQQSNFLIVKGAIAGKPENVELNKIVFRAHDESLPCVTDTIEFPAVGLPNLGNTCYISSVIQCIFRISYFQKLMIDHQTDKNDPGKSVTCMSLLSELYCKMLEEASMAEIKQFFLRFTKVMIELN